MQIHHKIRERDQFAVNVMRDLPRDRAIRIARKNPVQIEVINRRHAPPRECRRIIRHGQDNHAPLDPCRIKRLGQIGERHLAFIFIAMIAGSEKRGRAFAILHHHNRDGQKAIGAIMR